MDSKPIAIIIAIVATVGLMSAVGVTVGNIFTGTTTSTDLLPKTLDVISVDEDHLEVNIQFTNQGTDTLQNIKGTLEIDGKRKLSTPLSYSYPLIASPSDVEPYKTLILTGSIRDRIDKGFGLGSDGIYSTTVSTVGDKWDIYPGKSILLRVSATTSSGDIIEKLHTITVK